MRAQRKFAQGAYVPPSHNNNNNVPARADISITNLKEEKNVIHNNLSARNLLDIVSFQNMHKHLQPIVLLERLERPKDVPVQNGHEDHIVKEPDPAPVQPAPVVHREKPKLRLVARNSTMCLRSRTRINGKISRKPNMARKKLKPRLRLKRNIPVINKPKRKRVLEKTYSTSDLDDEKPLQYFKLNTKTKEMEVKRSKKTREKPMYIRVEAEIHESPEATRVTQSTSCNESITPATLEDNDKTQNLKEKSTFVERTDVPSATASTDCTTPSLVYYSDSESLPVSASQFYGRIGINKWMNSNSQPHFKTPLVPTQKTTFIQTEKRPSVDMNETRRGASPCPSESLRTINDVVSASKQEMASRCHTCSHCGRVDKIKRISNLMQHPTSVANSDVYEFNAEDERSAIIPQIYHGTRNSRTTDDTLYLDILPNDSPHIIEMRSENISGSSKRIMRARLILKSETQGKLSNELFLVEHEKLLDSLLDTLSIIDPSTPTKVVCNDAMTPQPSTSRSARSHKPAMTNTKLTFPKNVDGAKLVDAPTFVPTEAEFNDPIAFFEKIAPLAAKFGLCKVVAPKSFQPKCVLNDEMKFQVANQYIARLYSRWGPAAREMTAIKAYLATQNVKFTRAPLLDGVEVNLPKLYLLVQSNGGLRQVLEKKRWGRVAEEMRLTLTTKPERTLDRFYVKYLLPYDTLSNQERQQMMGAVEKCWIKKNQKLVDWALNPLHRQKKLLDESDSSDEDDADDEPPDVSEALTEAEDCVVKGRTMNLATFKKVAAKMVQTYFASPPTPEEVVKEYWRLVLLGTDHVCVNAASIDTGDGGYGFTKSKTDTWGKHPWNLKVISQNTGNVLRSLGAVLGVTLPTLHLGMVFSTSCWHRDPHGLPWIEFMHQGPSKIWYGIPNEQSSNFRKAVEALCPTSCQNKSIWLPSDITMIPPNLLLEHNVSLSHLVQNPGEFVIVFPKAYSSSISTGYTESESVYFATIAWLKTVHQVFQEVRASCEPTTFSLEQLLIAQAKDPRTSLGVLQEVHASLTTICNEELQNRRLLADKNLKVSVQNRARNQPKKRPPGAWNVREQDECEVCRATLYLSKVTGLTGKKSSVCLQHAIRLLETPKHNKRTLDTVELVIYYPEEELEGIMAAVQKRLFPRMRAQRKFAQGAYVPPSHNNNNNVPARADISITNLKEEKNVIHNNLSARNLLDIVSFQNMHKHLQPIVLLERLERPKDVPVQNGHEDHIVKEPDPAPVQPAPVVHREKPKLRLVARNSTMCLRSRTRINGKISRKPNMARKKLKPRLRLKRNIPVINKPKRKRVLEKTYSTSDLDDEKPLQYFKLNTKTKEMEVKRSKKTREKPMYIRVEAEIHESPEATRVTQSTSCNESITPATLEDNDKTQNLKEKSTFVERTDVPSATASTDCTTPSLVYYSDSESLPVSASQFYGRIGINKWMNSNSQPHFKTPLVPTQKTTFIQTEKRPSVDMNETRRGASPCPSESLRTINDVVSASKQEMASRCHTCSHCGRVDKIKRISNLMQHPTSVANSDVYEFNAEDERSAIIPQIYHGTRNSRTTDDTLYLDILPNDSPHIIEMRSENISGSSKRIMRARLILKSETQGKLSNELFLVEHEKLLDSLLDTLSIIDPSTPTKVVCNDAMTPQPSTSRSARSHKPAMTNTKLTFPKNVDGAKLVDAPTFVPTEAEFNDPIAFFEKIAPLAAKFGLCKVVAPKSFQPKCVLNDEMKFQVANQYIARLYSRWGPAAREMTAIKAYLATQNVKFTRAPLLDGVEVNLPKLYLLVQSNGGLRQVLEKKRWGRVAEEMRLTLTTKPERTLDRFYVKYLLPYDTLSNQERQQMMGAVEKCWIKKNQKLVDWALNPLHRQKKLLDESDSSDEDDADDEPPDVSEALTEAEDCVVKGRTMNLATFKKVAAKMVQTYFASPPTPEEVVKEYWRLVLLGTDHVCVNAASIDTGDGGYGFTKSKTDTWGKHPWNLKVISQNTGNVLRSLGAVLGVTLPTLHLGMVFSTSCWHRDPHGLPWIEFMHQGPSKIWYGIPNEQSSNFRKAVEALCPTSCQNKSIWLPSDITMIPPNLLLEHNVSLSHLVQNPGEFVIVFPKAYSSSISTGYTESESVYFATIAWLKTVHQVFQEVRASCEPTTFSLEQLLIAQAKDPRTSLGVLQEVHASLTTICNEELQNRRLLADKNLKVSVQNRARNQPKKRPPGAWNVREQDECEVCRATLYLSKVTGLTGKKSSVCLQHAIRLLETPKHNKRTLDTVELVIYYPEEELEGIMAAVQKRLFPRMRAQRKFAQGAYVPPSHNNNNNVPARADISITNLKEEKNVIHNNLSARNLLDIVSFQNMHKHLQPIVLLERLERPKDVPVQNGHEDHIVKEPDPAPVQPAPVVHREKPKLRLVARNSTMCLRSRTRINGKISRKPNMARKKLKPRLRLKRNIPVINKPKRKRVLEKTYSTSDLDDEKPLQYFKLNTKTKEMEVKRSKKTREKPMYIRVEAEIHESPEATRVTQSTSCNESITPATLEDNDKTQNLKEKSTFVERTDVPSATASTDCTTPSLVYYSDSESLPVSASQFYGRIGINKWMNSNSQPHFKTPLVPTQKTTFIQTEKRPSVDMNETRRGASPCPSESLRTINDVVSASKQEMASRCHTCSHCGRVDKIKRISNLMQHPTSVANSDVYEFNAEDERSAIIPQIYHGTRNSRTTDDTLYLDILPNDSPHIIEMRSENISGSSKRIMRARLILKSETQGKLSNELFLVEHEKLLDSLLDTLSIIDPSTPTKVVCNDAMTPQPSTSRSARSHKPAMTNTKLTFPKNVDGAKLVDAPTFVPTEAEFNDPIAFFEKIAPLAAKFGLCKVVAPKSFQPKCVLNDEMKFQVANQYIARLYSRWGPAAREMTAIKAYLATQNVKFTRAPLLDGVEVNLPKLYLLVQSNGGLRQVLEKKRWGRVAEEMRLTLTTKPERTLDRFYVKYLLPYDTLSNQERQQMMGAVEKCWIKKNQKLVDWALNPLHRQKKLLDESDSSDEDDADDEPPDVSEALTEAEDCVVKGRTMNLATFKKVAAKMVQTYFASPPTPEEVVKEYWRLVLLGTDHVCVNAASIDTGDGGYGFTKSKTDTWGKHPWNLKVISQNTGNVLRSLGAVLGVTLPTLHLGMVFSTSCWHRDPHGLPWIEFMHQGPSKIWYGIPNEQSSNFRKAVEALCPTSCQNKSIWLPSDITMIPPNLLLEHNVSLSHLVQNPGEFVIVFPKAYSSSISTGYTESESVYFATIAWLKTVHQVFQEVRASCEPTTFSLEQLLIAQAKDPRTSLGVLQEVHASLTTICNEELQNRRLLADKNLKVSVQNRARNQPKKRPPGAWNVREQDECEVCRATLYLSKVTGLTGKKSSVCLQHAIRLLETPKHNKRTLDTVELVIYYPEEELEGIMAAVQKRLFPRMRAQRKFAQGAYVPPSHNNNNNVPARADISITNLKEEKNVIHNNLSARNLLDIVSFQNMHKHLQPIVLLERLERPKDVPVQNGHEDHIVKEPDPAPVQPAPVVHREKPKLRLVARNSTMCLRSRTRINGKISRKPNMARKKLKPRLRLKRNIPVINKPKRKRVLEKTYSTSDLDDEKPLQYFKLNTKTKEMEVKRSKKTREKPMYIRVEAEIHESPEATRVTQSTSCNESITPATLEDNDKTQNLKEKSTFVERTDVPSATASTDCTTPSLVYYSDSESLPVSASQFYGRIGINKWMNSNSQPHFKTPLVPTQKTTFIQTEKRPSVDMNETRRGASPCPSESLRTINDVVSASKQEMASRCHTCSHCGRVDKIKRISNLMQHPTSVANSDVYEFNAEDERSAIIPQIYHGTRNSRTTDDTLYLDILPNDSPHIIEMRSENISGSSKRIMRARLILKSETQGKLSNELFLVEHEKLLDSLLDTLSIIDPSTPTKVVCNDAMTPQPSTSRSARSHKPAMTNTKLTFPKNVDGAKLVDAPTFVPTEAEFNDPIAFFEKIAPLAAKFGLCKVVAPKSFQPKCVLNDEMKFQVANQYIARLYSRWGPAAREMTAIKAYLATQNVKFTRAPLLDGVEVNLPKLYLLVQSNGGLRQVLEKKRWGRVAEEMRLTLTTKPERTLDRFYVKYLLPYDTLSNQERQQMMGAVEKCWIKKNQKLVDWALNPLHRQKKLLDESDSSDEDDADDEPPDVSEALTEAEDCVVKGRTMNLATFKKVAAKMVQTYFASPPTPEEVVKEYWRLVLLGTDHVCVNAASIDTGDGGYGFTKSKTDTWGKHPWNLKVISQNTGNVLRSLGAVLGVTLPTLHLGMVFSTSCWHRDPHGLPWIEFMHQGPSKIWYGIPNEQSSNFRKAVEALCPTSCQNKSIWLPSDITMIPPNLLLEHNVSLSHLVQNPGEFVIVFPKAYSSSISTGYTESESVYFATIAWLKTVHQVFQEVRASCEPTTFSLEQLLIAQAKDPRTSLGVLQEVHASLTTICNEELQNRRLLADKNLKVSVQNRARNQPKKRPPGAWNVREQDECEVCRATLYLSKVTGLTGKKSSVCLQHAIRLLETPKHNKRTLDTVELVIYYPEEELEGIMAAVQKRLFP